MEKRTFFAVVAGFSDDSKRHEIEPVPGERERVATQRAFGLTLKSWGEVPGWDTLFDDLAGVMRSKKLRVTIEETE